MATHSKLTEFVMGRGGAELNQFHPSQVTYCTIEPHRHLHSSRFELPRPILSQLAN
jgi:hypothetical protein